MVWAENCWHFGTWYGWKFTSTFGIDEIIAILITDSISSKLSTEETFPQAPQIKGGLWQNFLKVQTFLPPSLKVLLNKILATLPFSFLIFWFLIIHGGIVEFVRVLFDAHAILFLISLCHISLCPISISS